MSRIGKSPISVPSNVTIDISKSNLVVVKGPKGQLSEKIDHDIKVTLDDGIISIERPTDQPRHRALHGLSRSLLSNMIEGVTNGYKLTMELVGVGYRTSNTGNILELIIGYSHPIYYMIPEEVTVTTKTEKGSNPAIILESYDKQLVGQVAAKIRSFRKPEPYKGKGIKFAGEIIRRKAGKTGSKK
jgi:large subunit ribosomal protein L6